MAHRETKHEKDVLWMGSSVEYIQLLACWAGIVFALYVGVNAIVMQPDLWLLSVGLSVAYAWYNFALYRYRVSPTPLELIVNLSICGGLTFAGAEYSSILYQMLLIRMLFRVNRKRAKIVGVGITLVYLLTDFFTAPHIDIKYLMHMIFNLIGFAVLTVGTAYLHFIMAKRTNDERQMEELIERSNRNYYMAFTDGLTGLYNYRAYKEKVKGVSQYVLLVIDLDHFKKLNDTYGHLFGNKVLVNIANIIERGVREGDLAFRYGGEEFVVVLPDASAQIGHKIAERLRRQIEENDFYCGSTKVPITVSIGVAVKRPEAGNQTVFDQADRALYSAKQRGRNNVQAFRDVYSNCV